MNEPFDLLDGIVGGLDRQRVGRVGGILILVLVIAPFFVVAVPGAVGAEHGYVVLSDSMQPSIQAGDAVVVDEVSTESIEEGDVITFTPPSGSSFDEGGSERVTHRVVDVVQRDGRPHFQTKGDANEEVDPFLVPPDSVVGAVTFSIPYVGYVIQFANSDQGILALVILPAVLFGSNEIWTLYRDANRSGSEPDESDDSIDIPDGTPDDEQTLIDHESTGSSDGPDGFRDPKPQEDT